MYIAEGFQILMNVKALSYYMYLRVVKGQSQTILTYVCTCFRINTDFVFDYDLKAVFVS